jgi:DNA-binding CsgD family transcriptional regulator/tetratricopeptide (TPR) repeat protein
VVRLLEREAELELLTGAAEDTAGGRGSVVLVGGEAGIGKTSLVRALREHLDERVTFLSGACEPLSVPVPLAPWRELLDASAAGQDLQGLETADRLVLARWVLGALGARAPALAVVEDAHWADPLTLDILGMLARRIEDVGVTILVTYRDDEVAANPRLALMLGDLATSPAVRRVALRPLSAGGVQELAAGTGIDGARLLEATGGNPFLVVEALAAGGGLPASVRDAALARAGRLGGEARQVVDVAAVIGQRVEPRLLRSLMGECSAAVEEALARGVLVAEGSALGFRHELIREALEGCISPPRRAELHARVCRALSEQPEVAVARLAHHAELGGLTDEAARYARLAAAEAERVGALRETYLQADRALRFGRELDPAERFELLVQYSRAANFANPRLQDAVEAARDAVTVAEELGDGLRRGRALMALSGALWSLERVIEARDAAQEAIEAFGPTDDVGALAWAHATLLRMEATSFDPARAISAAPRARELADRAGLEEARIDVAISLGLARGHRGEREALAILTEALSAARSGGFTIRTVRAFVNLMTVSVGLREHACADQVAAEALALLEEWRVSPLPIMAIRSFRARSLLDRGRWEEALALTNRRERWWQGEFAVACAIDGLVRARRGKAGAADLIDEAWRNIIDLLAVESSRHGMIRLALVEAAWLAGDHAAGLAQLRAARDSPGVSQFARPGGEMALWAWRHGIAFDPPDGAPVPVLLELAGDWPGAIRAWRELGAPYEAALAALAGDDRAAREALSTLHTLGASGAVRAFVRARAARGATVARGPRRSTLANPAGLTRREQEVLEVLATGASNAAIAGALHLSERTVAHHVSAILAKLGARNRHLAVEQARSQGLLTQDGQAVRPR